MPRTAQRQTPKHQVKAQSILRQLIDSGLTPEEITSIADDLDQLAWDYAMNVAQAKNRALYDKLYHQG